MTLDEITAAADDIKRQQQREGIRQMVAEIATDAEKRRIAEEDWQAPPDVERIPETPAPADWFIRGEIAKAKQAAELPHYMIEDTD